MFFLLLFFILSKKIPHFSCDIVKCLPRGQFIKERKLSTSYTILHIVFAYPHSLFLEYRCLLITTDGSCMLFLVLTIYLSFKSFLFLTGMEDGR